MKKIVGKWLIIAYLRGKAPLKIYYRRKNAHRKVPQVNPHPQKIASKE